MTDDLYSYIPDDLSGSAISTSIRLDPKDETRTAVLLESVRTGRHKTIEQKVALILNKYPSSRDSDVELQIRYWQIWMAGMV